MRLAVYSGQGCLGSSAWFTLNHVARVTQPLHSAVSTIVGARLRAIRPQAASYVLSRLRNEQRGWGKFHSGVHEKETFHSKRYKDVL